jgi:hypothetical protein
MERAQEFRNPLDNRDGDYFDFRADERGERN